MQIVTVMTPDEAEVLRRRVEGLEFVDGVVTARGGAKDVKRNAQTAHRCEAVARAVDEVTALLADDPVLQRTAFPKSFVGMRFSRYGVGDHYGMHVDAALFGSMEAAHRTDLSFTLFLSDPDDYEGGELHVASGVGSPRVRLPAGQMLVYPTHLLHEVAPVRRGVRYACVGWIESWVPDPQLRDILARVGAVRDALADEGAGPFPRVMLDEVWNSLLRYGAR